MLSNLYKKNKKNKSQSKIVRSKLESVEFEVLCRDFKVYFEFCI